MGPGLRGSMSGRSRRRLCRPSGADFRNRIAVLARRMRRQLVGEFEINPTITVHDQSRFGRDLFEFAPRRLAVCPDHFEYNVRMSFLDHLELPNPWPEIEQ